MSLLLPHQDFAAASVRTSTSGHGAESCSATEHLGWMDEDRREKPVFWTPPSLKSSLPALALEVSVDRRGGHPCSCDGDHPAS